MDPPVNAGGALMVTVFEVCPVAVTTALKQSVRLKVMVQLVELELMIVPQLQVQPLAAVQPAPSE